MDLQELTQQLRDYYKDTEMISDLDDFNEHDEQGIDLYINNAEMLEWSEDLYNQWIDFIQNYKLDGEGYDLVFNTDGSGYNYWIKNQEETPHLSLVVEIDDLSKINTDKLLEDINTALQQYDNEETRLWQIANEKNEDITTLTDKIDKADSELEELIKSLNKTIQEALEEDVESLEKKVNKADDDLKTIIKTLKENFKASDFEDLNLHDIHYHGTNKDGTLDFICYELQGKDLKRTVLYKDADVEIYAYTDTLDKKEVHLMIKPIIELTTNDIERIAIDAKEQLDKKLK